MPIWKRRLRIGPRYDLILAADTLVYLGDLRPCFDAAPGPSVAGWLFSFHRRKRKHGDGFELGPKRRWRHSEAYLRELAAAAGLARGRACGRRATPEANQPVAGFAVALTAA